MTKETVKTYCDRCGKEVHNDWRLIPQFIVLKRRRYFLKKCSYNARIDLCADCETSLDRWMTCKEDN